MCFNWKIWKNSSQIYDIKRILHRNFTNFWWKFKEILIPKVGTLDVQIANFLFLDVQLNQSNRTFLNFVFHLQLLHDISFRNPFNTLQLINQSEWLNYFTYCTSRGDQLFSRRRGSKWAPTPTYNSQFQPNPHTNQFTSLIKPMDTAHITNWITDTANQSTVGAPIGNWPVGSVAKYIQTEQSIFITFHSQRNFSSLQHSKTPQSIK